jgi:hypothetical protein
VSTLQTQHPARPFLGDLKGLRETVRGCPTRPEPRPSVFSDDWQPGDGGAQHETAATVDPKAQPATAGRPRQTAQAVTTRARGFGPSVPRSLRRCRPQARRLNPAGLSFGFGGLGKLLLLLRLALGRRGRSRPAKSGGPPLLAPSFKVQGDIAHNRNSGFAVLPQCDDLNAHRVRKAPQGIRIGRLCAGANRRLSLARRSAFQVLVVRQFDCGSELSA